MVATVERVTDEQGQERRRQNLLRDLYGPKVPTNLGGQLLRTIDVANLFQVSERTVSEWARQGRIPSVRTPGGHRRYPADEVRRLLGGPDEASGPEADRPGEAGVTNLTDRRSAAG